MSEAARSVPPGFNPGILMVTCFIQGGTFLFADFGTFLFALDIRIYLEVKE